MNKKFIQNAFGILCVTMLIAFASCGKKDSNYSDRSNENVNTTTGKPTDSSTITKNKTDNTSTADTTKNKLLPEGTTAVAVLNPLGSSKVSGKVTFTSTKDGMKITAEIEGLTPGKHGFHIHEKGDCSSPDGKSAGDHFNPTNMQHAGHDSDKRHEGDMGNITADKDGKATLNLTDKIMTFNGLNSIIGKGVIVHEKEDDLKTQPSGDAGNRLACGVIELKK